MEEVNLSNLEPHYINVEFLIQTASQIIKDFEQQGHEIIFSGNPDTAYSELFIQVKPILLRLSQNNHSQFLNLLYRIDLDEKEIANHKSKIQETEYFDKLTDAVLQRELKKVIIRNYYKLKNDSN